MRLVIALGGNALLHRGEAPEASTQNARLALAAPALSRLANENQVIFVHGNGPQIGLLARESAEDRALTAPYPLTSLGAETQGLVGSLLSLALRNAGLAGPIVTLLTHTVISPDDPALNSPSKFIGALYDHRRARQLAASLGWMISQDGPGWRRVVPSPLPQTVVESDSAALLLSSGTTVIMGGGGGVPVVGNNSHIPVEAVIDKDHTAALLAKTLGADLLIILTDVPGVIADFGSAEARVISEATPQLLRTLPFPPGSMGPKVDAVCGFVEATGKHAAIGSLEHAEEIVAGTVGTQISDRVDLDIIPGTSSPL